MVEESLRESLLGLFREFDTLSSISLIASIAAHWGGLVAERDRHDNGRIIGEKVRGFMFDREPAPNRPSFLGGRTASSADIWELGLEWAKVLVKMPEDETLMVFGEAFWEWLLTADLSIYRHEEDTDFTIVGTAFQYWCDDLGI